MRAAAFSMPEIICQQLVSGKKLQSLQCQNTEPNLCLQGTCGLLVKEINIFEDNY